jgi:hypothetical protein
VTSSVAQIFTKLHKKRLLLSQCLLVWYHTKKPELYSYPQLYYTKEYNTIPSMQECKLYIILITEKTLMKIKSKSFKIKITEKLNKIRSLKLKAIKNL